MLQKCLVNTNKDASLKFRLQETRTLVNDIQHYRKLVVERLSDIVPWLGRRMHFAGGGKMFMKNVELPDGYYQYGSPFED